MEVLTLSLFLPSPVLLYQCIQPRILMINENQAIDKKRLHIPSTSHG